jgi:hypothetical protein
MANRRVKESIVRTLSVPWAKGFAEAALLAEFRSASDSENLGLKWAIANALEVLATDKIFDDIVELVRDKRNGRAREMLAMALGKMKNPKAVNVLIGLLDDDEVAGHAIIALRKLNATEARPYILPFIKHPKPWIRREAKKALNKNSFVPRPLPVRRFASRDDAAHPPANCQPNERPGYLIVGKGPQNGAIAANNARQATEDHADNKAENERDKIVQPLVLFHVIREEC